ncbi:hypothetical protein NKH91_31365 [Mesorhizobium sp. M0894]|uniref:hypothetical protein n=1 Tax=unclassified Mesorhizobium TaxID=325217 RepID=UPI0033352C3D
MTVPLFMEDGHRRRAGQYLLPPCNEDFKTRADWPSQANKTFHVVFQLFGLRQNRKLAKQAFVAVQTNQTECPMLPLETHIL